MSIERRQVTIGRSLVDVGVKVRCTEDTGTSTPLSLMEETGRETPHLWITRAANANIKEDKPPGCFLNCSANIRSYF